LRKLFLSVSIFLFIPASYCFQNNYDKSFYGGLFYLSEFIASDQFAELRKNHNDPELVDLIYRKAYDFYDGDISEALLALTFACLPFNRIRTRFLFGSELMIPLPSPPESVFKTKVKNLPKNIFFNSPETEFSDKDKLAHFFGNAFLRYNFGFFNLSKFMGIFVETVEEGLFIEGGYSNLDIITNHLGELFAESVKENNSLLPSSVLNVYQLFYFRMRQ